MSGAEPLEGLSLACNILKVLSFLKYVIDVSLALREDRAPDCSLNIIVHDLSQAVQSLRLSLQQAPQALSTQDEVI